MASRRRTSPAAGPLEDDDLLAEILLRLPPKPSSLPRVSLVCKRWRSIATDAAFRRRFRIRHRKPPILGLFDEGFTDLTFMPLSDPPDRIPSERFSLDLRVDGCGAWDTLGCRHGRVLLIDRRRRLLLLFEPVSGDTHRILIPPEFVGDGFTTTNGAVLCAAGDNQDHVHGDCHSSPFKVVVVGTRKRQQSAVACVYSSETGIWGDVASLAQPCTGYVSCIPCTLIGTSLYWSLNGYEPNSDGEDEHDGILKFDLDSQSLTLITKHPAGPASCKNWIIRGEDGSLGLAILRYPSFELWDCKVDCHGVATWVMRKDVNMDAMLGPNMNYVTIVGYAEDADAILISMYGDTHMFVLTIIQLESMMVKECREGFSSSIYHPLTNFYTTGTARA